MPRLGAHLSIAGGLPRAIDRAVAAGCETLQIFTKSVGQWRAREIPPEERDAFRRRARETRVAPIVAHDSYLINVASADPALRAKSVAALGEELDRADALGLDGLVMHPGSHASETEGLASSRRRCAGLLRTRGRRLALRILLEHTAGQGTNLGHRFEHLAAIISERRTDAASSVSASTRAISSPPATTSRRRTAIARRSTSFDRVVGLDRLGVVPPQ